MIDAVFDTTVFIDAYNRNQRAMHMLADVASGRLSAGYSPVTVYELWIRTMSRAEEAFHASLLATLEEIPLDSVMARQVSSWLAPSTRAQRLRLASDAIIAATAASVGATIITRNPRDFTRFYSDVQSY
jgi:predicted nucleic acid-binding protein